MLRRLLKKRLLKIVVMILLAPYALTLIYWVVPPPSTLMLADIATLHLPKRDWVSLSEISPNLIAAVVASEDGTFCEHWGFDFAQMEKALDAAEDGRKLRGASTITQQTAKNLFLWNGRSWVRKILEAPLTLWMEIVLSKRRILEIYLNIAEWDDGVYGAQAAAQAQFGTSAKNLSLAQAALLASALPSPGHMRPTQAGVIAARAQNHGPDLSCLR